MKASAAILKGYEQVGGKQCAGAYTEYDRSGRPIAYCVIGASIAGGKILSDGAFYEAWGIYPITLNDEDGMPWEHIYGMAVAAGL